MNLQTFGALFFFSFLFSQAKQHQKTGLTFYFSSQSLLRKIFNYCLRKNSSCVVIRRMRWNNFRACRTSARPLEQFSVLAALQRSRWNSFPRSPHSSAAAGTVFVLAALQRSRWNSFRARRTPARLLNKISANDTGFCFISYFCNEIH